MLTHPLNPRAALALYNALRAELGVYMPRITGSKLDEFASKLALELADAGFEIVPKDKLIDSLLDGIQCPQCYGSGQSLPSVTSSNPEIVANVIDRVLARCPATNRRGQHHTIYCVFLLGHEGTHSFQRTEADETEL